MLRQIIEHAAVVDRMVQYYIDTQMFFLSFAVLHVMCRALQVRTTKDGVLLGASNTLRCLIDTLQHHVDASANLLTSETGANVATFKVLIKHVLKIANHHASTQTVNTRSVSMFRNIEGHSRGCVRLDQGLS